MGINLCTMNVQDKEKNFEKLINCVNNCSLCPNMESRTGVLSELNGNIYSNVLFIAEAPGRLGADKTRIPLFGDQTGVNFQRLIDTIGWSREDFFITNAVLCNPRDASGNNATPCKKHIKNCSIFLHTLIHIIQPEYVVTLGQKALESVQYIDCVKATLKDNVRSTIRWYGRILIPLYHMGPRALIHRSFYNQLSDFYWLQNTIKVKSKPWGRLKKSRLIKSIQTKAFNASRLQKLIIDILTKTGPITEFKLTKIIYLTDYNYLKKHKKLLTNNYYIRAYAGPLPVGLDKQLNQLFNEGYIRFGKGNIICLNKFFSTDFSKEEQLIIDNVIDRYALKPDRDIKTAAYLTKPMKRILRIEKNNSEKMLWKSVFCEEDFL